ncbi:MAG: thiamine-phosphate synthase family protein [Candidatus Methanomethylicaceae archaeon]
MNPPCEIVVRKFLPVLRVLVAKELSQTYNWPQTKIADRLGVTQAAVSGYLSQDESTLVSPPFDLEELKAIARSIAAEINMRKKGQIDTIYEVCKICLNLRKGGIICHAHKIKIPNLVEERCSICMQLHIGVAIDVMDLRRKVINELKSALELIETTQEFSIILPEVFSNIVMAIDGAKTISDIAGIPGRIVRFRGKAKALLEPEFGVSGHLGKVLLKVMKINPELRAAINICYNKYVKSAIERLGLKTYVLKRDPTSRGDEKTLLDFIDDLAKKNVGWVDAIIDEGGFGIEPNTYLFGTSAIEVADRAVRIARMVSIMKKNNMV